jgi:hypothetical protein
MKKIIFGIFAFFLAFNSNAQGIHGGFSTGSQIFKVEVGYSLNENLHAGVYYSPGMDLSVIPLPSSYGVYGRYTFEKNAIFNNDWFEVNMRPYLGASLGQIHTNEIVTLSSSFSTSGNNRITPAKTEFGYLASGGIELLYGSNSSWGSFFEIGLGKAPSYFTAVSSTATGISSGVEPVGTSTFSFNAGIRFYLQ